MKVVFHVAKKEACKHSFKIYPIIIKWGIILLLVYFLLFYVPDVPYIFYKHFDFGFEFNHPCWTGRECLRHLIPLSCMFFNEQNISIIVLNSYKINSKQPVFVW